MQTEPGETVVEIKVHKSAKGFLRQVGPHLYKNEAENGLILGICETLASSVHHYKQSPLLLRAAKEGKTRTVAVQTPPHNLILSSGSPSDLKILAKFLFEKDMSFPGVIGPIKEVESFLEHWRKLKTVKIQQTIKQGIYRLDRVIFPSEKSGRMELAQPADQRRLGRWLGDFFAESLPSDARSAKENLAVARHKIEQKQAYVWRVGRTAVSMVFASRPTRNGIAIGPVFTPVSHREHGYASALVAHASQHLLDEGKKFCTLYTDLSNPTSNRIYQRIGYYPIGDSQHVAFR